MTAGKSDGGRPGGVPLAHTPGSHCPTHGAERCACSRNGQGKVLTMCGNCVGSGKVKIKGERHQLRACAACHGEGVR